MAPRTHFPAPALLRLAAGALWAILLGLLLMACGGDKKDDSAQQSTATPTIGATGLQVGDAAPDFSLPAAGGGTVALADYKGRQPVLLFFHMADG